MHRQKTVCAYGTKDNLWSITDTAGLSCHACDVSAIASSEHLLHDTKHEGHIDVLKQQIVKLFHDRNVLQSCWYTGIHQALSAFADT